MLYLHFIFTFQDCRQPFNGGSFFDHEGQPYCELHYHAKRGSLCAGCHKPISGRCVTAMSRKFHPEHFVCSFCLKQLNKGTFKEQNDKPYCHPCFEKLFAWRISSISCLTTANSQLFIWELYYFYLQIYSILFLNVRLAFCWVQEIFKVVKSDNWGKLFFSSFAKTYENGYFIRHIITNMLKAQIYKNIVLRK